MTPLICPTCRDRGRRPPSPARFLTAPISCPLEQPLLPGYGLSFVCGKHAEGFRGRGFAVLDLPSADGNMQAPRRKLGRRVVTLAAFVDLTMQEVARALDVRIEHVRSEVALLTIEGFVSADAADGWQVVRATEMWHPDDPEVGQEGGPHTPRRRFGDHLDDESKWYGTERHAAEPERAP